MVSLCGFVVQFIGLRGMHWSASIAQLGAVLVMTSLRAWVRRGLAKPPQCQLLSSGFELDWFAMTLGDLESAPWLHPSEAEGKRHSRPCWDWRIVTGGGPAMYKPFQKKRQQTSEPEDPDTPSKAHRVMTIRRDLGELADWRGPASAESIALARSIEVTMDALFDSRTGKFTWTLKACGGELINFRLERHRNKNWKAYSDEIEAALSLWLYSVSEQEQDHQQEQRKQAAQRTLHKDDAWLRATGSPAKRSLRLLGAYTQGLYRDLQWWMSDGASRVIGVHAAEPDATKIEVESHRIVGSGNRTTDLPSTYRIWQPSQTTGHDTTNPHVEEGKAANALLATESYSPLKLLYAQDMFSAFMWATAKTLTKPIEGGADIRPDEISSDNAWQSFTLLNGQLSKMAQDIQSTGLGSIEDIYHSIIPPLSVEHKLPQADAIIELARQHAKRHEQLGHWKEAADAYLWLFRTAKTFPEQSGIAAKATAVLMEYLRLVTSAIQLREAQQEESDLQRLKELKKTLEKELKSGVPWILSRLMKLYQDQGRPWKCDFVQEDTSVGEDEYDWGEVFNFTELHRLAQSNEPWRLVEKLEKEENVNPKDIHDWTPLHYAAAKGFAGVTKQLLQRQADVNARDLLEWTPLHYACQRGETSILQNLLREGAYINAQGRDGVAPLHCAAMNGNQSVVVSLLEAGAAIDILDAPGNTPLLWAAYKGHKDVVKYLWPDTNKKLRDNSGRTALHLAATAGMEEVVRLLIDELGADKKAKNNAGRTPLHLAAASGHWDVVRLLVHEQGADKEAKDDYGQTLLHLAAGHGKEDVVRLLIDELGADKEAKNKDGQTPLHLAAASGHWDVVRLLVHEQGADKEAKDGYGQTPLHIAAASGHWDVVRLLVHEQGADKEAKDGYGRTPLHLAAGNGKEDIVRLLIDELGADKEAKNDYGQTPLHLAVWDGYEDVVRLLVHELGADKEAKHKDGQTPLHLAVWNGYEDVVRLLVHELGADKEAKDNAGQTPLHLAAGYWKEDIVRLLIDELGADKEAKDDYGQTLLHLAAGHGKEDIVRLLIDELGADKEAKNKDGQTPLHLAAGNGKEDIVRLLVHELGADKEAKDNAGQTPLHLAAGYGKEDIVRLLIDELGADKEAKNNAGRTPLHLAAASGHWDVVRLLVHEQGADKEAKDNAGQTPLHLAAGNGKEDIVRLLIDELGADNDGQTPLHLAAYPTAGDDVELS
ncbi:hypothetical protein FNYG_14637 [Fusarium nygamai]|uniref:Uncharacterized protein n=1 Tax=Gibberella nygamai TaxID=42673 RepID=A0A2K0US91_GIBNY|nr:hypothetical protein FNYG_14637 [Fusarium nygamai]